MSDKTPIEMACELVGSQSALARKIGVKPQAVQKWVAKKYTPIRRALAVEKATDGKIKASQLCPDFYQAA